MRCRVLKRDVELAMLDFLVEHARERGIVLIAGYYSRTQRMEWSRITTHASGSRMNVSSAANVPLAGS
ncbi:MAG TPA: hypothetical protein VGG72_35505 [Bryobacteraceae bacterium]|jgi:hypothetical protein